MNLTLTFYLEVKTSMTYFSVSSDKSMYEHNSLGLCSTQNEWSHVTRKPVCRVSDQVRHKQGCTDTEDVKRLEIVEGLYCQVLISCRVTAQLFCAFVFANANCRFSHDVAQMYITDLFQNFI